MKDTNPKPIALLLDYNHPALNNQKDGLDIITDKFSQYELHKKR
jgi:hypothetical protein